MNPFKNLSSIWSLTSHIACTKQLNEHVYNHFSHSYVKELAFTFQNVYISPKGSQIIILFFFFSKKKEINKSWKLRFYGQVEEYGAQREIVISVCKFLFRIWILFAPPTLLLVHRSVLFKMYLFIFFIYLFLLIKNPLTWYIERDLTAKNCILGWFFTSLVFFVMNADHKFAALNWNYVSVQDTAGHSELRLIDGDPHIWNWPTKNL